MITMSTNAGIANEKEVLEIKGVEAAALENFRRKYVWFVRDGYLVRSPVRINGVKLPSEERRSAEDEWIRKEKRKRRKGRSILEIEQHSFHEKLSWIGSEMESVGGRKGVVWFGPPKNLPGKLASDPTVTLRKHDKGSLLPDIEDFPEFRRVREQLAVWELRSFLSFP